MCFKSSFKYIARRESIIAASQIIEQIDDQTIIFPSCSVLISPIDIKLLLIAFQDPV